MNDHPDLRSLYDDMMPPSGAPDRLRTRLDSADNTYDAVVWVFTHRVAAGMAAAWMITALLHAWPTDPLTGTDMSDWLGTDTEVVLGSILPDYEPLTD